MSFLAFKGMPLTTCEMGAGEVGHSDVFDLRDSVELYMLLKVSAASQSLTVNWEKSIDGLNWENGGNFTATSSAAVETLTVTSGIYRFIRFKYILAAAGSATFEVDVFTKNYSS